MDGEKARVPDPDRKERGCKVVLRTTDNVTHDLQNLKVVLEDVEQTMLLSCGLATYHALGELSYPLSAASSWISRAHDLISKDVEELRRGEGRPSSILYRFAGKSGKEEDEQFYETRVLMDTLGNVYQSEPFMRDSAITFSYEKVGRIKKDRKSSRRKSQ